MYYFSIHILGSCNRPGQFRVQSQPQNFTPGLNQARDRPAAPQKLGPLSEPPIRNMVNNALDRVRWIASVGSHPLDHIRWITSVGSHPWDHIRWIASVGSLSTTTAVD
jgi:hypothetical protein